MTVPFGGFKSLIENSPDAISLIDTQGEILYGSATTTKMFGYQPDELVGRNCLDLVHPEDLDYSSWALQEVLAQPQGRLQWDVRVRHKDGKYSWVESTAYNLLLESDVQAIAINQRNIDARRATEEQSQRHVEELARSNLRLEEFAYTAAHDLREPLRAISSYTKTLVENVRMDGETKQMAKFIVDGAARMSTLVDDLLSFANTGKYEPLRRVDLKHVMASAIRNMAFAIKAAGATVTVHPLPIVQSDEKRLVRLLENLLSNALKYRRDEPLRIHVSAERHGPDWVIKINDNGLGIAPQYQTRVFLPFIRLVNRDVPGTGLGLAVCKKIVEGLGGAIWVESKVGVGSTFCFTIRTAAEEIPVQDLPQRRGHSVVARASAETAAGGSGMDVRRGEFNWPVRHDIRGFMLPEENDRDLNRQNAVVRKAPSIERKAVRHSRTKLPADSQENIIFADITWIADELIEIRNIERQLSQEIASGVGQDTTQLLDGIEGLRLRMDGLDHALDEYRQPKPPRAPTLSSSRKHARNVSR